MSTKYNLKEMDALITKSDWYKWCSKISLILGFVLILYVNRSDNNYNWSVKCVVFSTPSILELKQRTMLRKGVDFIRQNECDEKHLTYNASYLKFIKI